MKLGTKTNIAVLLLLLLPMTVAICGLSLYYMRKLERETHSKLDANRQTAALLIENRLEEMRKLAIAYASDSALRFLIVEPEYFKRKLKHHLLYIAQESSIDAALIVWQQNQEIEAFCAYADGALSLMATAPIYDRQGDHKATLQIHQQFAKSDLLDNIRNQTGLSAIIESSSDKDRRWSAAIPLLNSQGHQLATLIVHHNPAPLFASQKYALLLFSGLGTGGLILILLLQRLLKYHIVRPLYQLQLAAQSVQDGNFHVTLQERPDEIGHLTKAFVRMAASLSNHFEQYQTLIARSTNGMAVIQNERIVFCNDRFPALLDTTSNKILQTPVQKVFRGEIPEEALQVRQTWLKCAQSDILWQYKPAVLLTLQDITAQKQCEIERERERQALQAENLRLRESMRTRDHFDKIVGKSLPMQHIYDLLPNTASSDATVLITGETGTGKGLLAHTIYNHSPRKNKPFVPVNCGAVPEQLFENEFFGHVKGAFTGADRTTAGFLKHAEGGTLFLDEVGELPLSMQVKFLHLLDGDGYTPVGSSLKHYPDIRVVAATNKDIDQLIDQKKLREDFYYRINVLSLTLPPLRNRKDDIPLLIEHFLSRYDDFDEVQEEMIDQFCAYAWPGNIRELKNAIKRIAAGHNSLLQRTRNSQIYASNFQESMELYEKFLIETALLQTGGHRESSASLLGISERSFYRKLKKFGLS